MVGCAGPSTAPGPQRIFEGEGPGPREVTRRDSPGAVHLDWLGEHRYTLDTLSIDARGWARRRDVGRRTPQGWKWTMARMDGVAAKAGGWFTRLAFWMARRKLKQITGRAALVAPVKVTAHHPRLLMAMGQMEAGRRRRNRFPRYSSLWL